MNASTIHISPQKSRFLKAAWLCLKLIYFVGYVGHLTPENCSKQRTT